MTSKSPSKSVQDYESDADALMDELFRDVEDSFSTQAALPESDGDSTSGDRSPANPSKSNRRSRSRAVPWVAVAVGGLAAASATVLWWSYVHLPKRLALLSGHSVASSSLSEEADAGDANSLSTANNASESSHSFSDAINATGNVVSEAVSGVVEDAVETSATAASDLVAAAQPNPASAGADPTIASIEVDPTIQVDQAEVDRILAATAPAPVPVAPPAVAYAPPPPPAPAPPPAPDMTLVGVMDGSDGAAIALVMVGNNMRQVAVGEAIGGGWRVASIDARSVSVTNGVQSEVLGL